MSGFISICSNNASVVTGASGRCVARVLIAVIQIILAVLWVGKPRHVAQKDTH